MSIVSIAEIISNVSVHGIAVSQIKQADVDATEWKRARTALGADMYDAILADIADETALYTVIIDYLKKALSFYTIADTINRFNTEISDRGLFNLQADNASKPDLNGVDSVKSELLEQGNQHLSKVIDWLIENETDDYINNMSETADDYNKPIYTSNTKRSTRL